VPSQGSGLQFFIPPQNCQRYCLPTAKVPEKPGEVMAMHGGLGKWWKSVSGNIKENQSFHHVK